VKLINLIISFLGGVFRLCAVILLVEAMLIGVVMVAYFFHAAVTELTGQNQLARFMRWLDARNNR
jgi:hypothetical protein